jgi:hypothetical protein
MKSMPVASKTRQGLSPAREWTERQNSFQRKKATRTHLARVQSNWKSAGMKFFQITVSVAVVVAVWYLVQLLHFRMEQKRQVPERLQGNPF